MLLLLLAAGLQAQTFIPVDYRFFDAPFVRPDSNVIGITNRSGNIRSAEFISAASNGYGTWVANDNGDWFLMSNNMVPIGGSLDAHGAIAMGEIGTTSTPAEVKVAANLKGRVSFVYPSTNRAQFVLYGLNDDIASGSPSIDIRFNGIPKGANSREVFKGSPTIFNVPTMTGGSNHPIYTPGGSDEPYWQDMFDVAKDEEFTYIVWQYNNTSTSKFEIWVTVVNNFTGMTFPGFPMQITNQGPLKPTEGRRPTISCDVRHNSGAFPFTKPRFDVAFIDQIPDIGSTGGGQIWHVYYNDPLFTFTAQPLMVQRTTSGFATSYSMPMHARMLTGSVPGLATPAKAIYVIVDGGLTQLLGDLIIHRITANTVTGPNAWYVDGANSALGGHEAPLDILDPNQDDLPVYNLSINGLANPYDGEPSDAAYNEFHCLYSLSTTGKLPYSLLNTACMIIRGNDNGLFGTPDTRTILNKRHSNPGQNWEWVWTYDPEYGTLVAGVNQMGIHVYWHTIVPNAPEDIQVEYYVRDIRRFDEDIEENTLVTEPCYVADGSSHFGTVGATLNPGKTMTLWSDPVSNVGIFGGIPSAGKYVPTLGGAGETTIRDGRLLFEDPGVTLNIGLNNSTDNGSTFIALPNYAVIFSDPTQKLLVNQGSEFIFYGYEPNEEYETTQDESNCGFIGGGSLELKGGGATITGGDFGFPSSLTRPATLTLHPGAELRLSENCNFKAEQSQIDILFGPSIYPPYSPPATNPDACGKLTAHGKLTLTECIVSSNIGSGKEFDIVHAKSCMAPSCSTTTNQTTITNTLVQNTEAGGKSNLRFTNWYGEAGVYFRNQRPARVQGGKFDRTSILVENPLASFDVLDGVFDNINDVAIEYDRSITESYSGIDVNRNQFLTFVDDAEAAIKFTDFDQYIFTTETSEIPRILIEGNICTTATTQPVEAAIKLTRTAAAVLGNTITGVGYKIGIENFRDNDPYAVATHTFMCENEIRNCSDGSGTGAGILTEKWFGYIKTSTIKENDRGYVSGIDDDGGIVGTYIEDNDGPGILINSSSAIINISGVHGGEDENDYSSSNSIKHNNQNLSAASGQIEIAAGTLLMGNPGGGYLNYGHNNIIRNGSTDNFIYSASSLNIGNIDDNYWGGYSVDPDDDGDDQYFPNLTFTHTISLSNEQTVPDYFCSMGSYGNKRKDRVLSVAQETFCEDLYARGYGYAHGGPFQKGYDTLRYYIEQCALEPNSYRAFTTISGANSFRNEDMNRYKEYREWLKKVLYYNTDTMYYCSDVNSIIGTFYWFDSVRGGDRLGAIAIIEYLIESGKCPAFVNDWRPGIQGGIDLYIERWRDTVQDSIATPLDTTRPTLEELDLEILKGQQGNVANDRWDGKAVINNLLAYPNPIKDETEVKYSLNDGAVVRIEIFDALGRIMYSAGLGYQPKRPHSIKVQTVGWSSGTYYARVALLSGEVRTIQLTKQ